MKSLRDRIPYSAIIDRPQLTLPGDARIAVWTIVNVETWDIGRAMPRTVLPPPMGEPLIPDLPNWAWHEYGMRVGFWRLHDSLKRFGITPTLALNSSVCEVYPRVAEAALEENWEFMGHSHIQGPMHRLDNQQDTIRRAVETIGAFAGRAPRGWESPGLTEDDETIDLLAEAGIEYVADWVVDDQPCMIETRSGAVASIPYTVETNDIAVFALQQHSSDEFLKRSIAQFERLYQEGESITRIMAISLHPYISGVAHRIGYLEQLYEHILAKSGVVMWTGEQILDWYLAELEKNRRSTAQ